MPNKLVIVESPTKAKTIRKFLPKDFTVAASMGHVRDLPQSAAEIPAALKGEEWAKIGVDVEHDFAPLYVMSRGKSKVISELKALLKEADELYLATDEDREGESISWHLTELLKPKVPVKRMVFHEITKTAITEALEHCRDIDDRLVRAQETRRILDRLVGYTVSPLLWKKIAYGLSAGRVQSAGLRLLVERERERILFRSAQYWDAQATLTKGSDAFPARLISVAGQRIATGKDFDERTGALKAKKDVLMLDEARAKTLCARLQSTMWKVAGVEEKEATARPAPPFVTSTLQQEANRKLGLSVRDTMRIAQRLYEEGLITYMRTDSPALSKQGIAGARSCVEHLYGADYLSPVPRQFSSKSAGAQEAHEAIRPAGGSFVLPRDTGLTGRELALYDLIWKRTVACQMADAKKLNLTAHISADDAEFHATGTRIVFPGFLRAYVEGSDDPEAALEDKETLLPALVAGDALKLRELLPQAHETKPPARYTEAALVQRLEKEGIGRPSTYASIISTVLDRGYAFKSGNALVPTFTGFAVIQLLERNFAQLVDLGFTSQMEQALDRIADGSEQWLPYLRSFYLGKSGLREQVREKEEFIDPESSRTVEFPANLGAAIKIGRYGPYLTQEGGDTHASIPEDTAPADLTREAAQELLRTQAEGPKALGIDPKTNEAIYCLVGRFGPYVQRGEATEDNPKPRRSSVPKGTDWRSITLEQALSLLSLPRDLGPHPADGKPVKAGLGRFGPYIMHEGDFRSLKKEDDLLTITLERALELLSEEKRGRRGAASKALRELGVHPNDKKPVGLYDGKYGPYVKHGSKNASLPKDADPASFTLEQAVTLLAAKTSAKRSGKTASSRTKRKK